MYFLAIPLLLLTIMVSTVFGQCTFTLNGWPSESEVDSIIVFQNGNAAHYKPNPTGDPHKIEFCTSGRTVFGIVAPKHNHNSYQLMYVHSTYNNDQNKRIIRNYGYIFSETCEHETDAKGWCESLTSNKAKEDFINYHTGNTETFCPSINQIRFRKWHFTTLEKHSQLLASRIAEIVRMRNNFTIGTERIIRLKKNRDVCSVVTISSEKPPAGDTLTIESSYFTCNDDTMLHLNTYRFSQQ